MNSARLVWHYTVRYKMEPILNSGALFPAMLGIHTDERPVVWFSGNQLWEPTADKMFYNDKGELTKLSRTKMREIVGGFNRFGIEPDKLIPWKNLRTEARIPKEVQRDLVKVAKDKGANPNHWFGHIGYVLLSEIAAIEETDIDGRWKPIGRTANT